MTPGRPFLWPLAYARERLRYAERREWPRLLVRGLLLGPTRRVWSRTELRFYVFNADALRALPNPRRFHRDDRDDLQRYERLSFHDQMPKELFLSTSDERLRNGQHVYTLVEDGVLLHYLWMAERYTFSPDPKTGLAFLPPEGSSAVWNSFTHPRARRRGLFKQSLSQAVHDAVALAGAKRVYGTAVAENIASRRAMESVGFLYAGSLIRDMRLGRVARYGTPSTFPVRLL